METLVADSLQQLIRFEKKRFLEGQGTEGGTAAGFRKHIVGLYGDEKHRYIEALQDAADRGWRQAPRKKGADLFCIGGAELPEYLTRATKHYVTGGDVEDDEEGGDVFEQVDHMSATVQDLIEDSTIKLRKAAQASAAADRRAKQADEALRRAKGDTSMLLKDLADA